MRKKSDFILRLCLVIGDALALILSFAMAYFIRVHVDPRPYVFEAQLLDFTVTIVLLVPIMLVILAALGLYKKSIFLGKARLPERARLVLAAMLTVSALIVYDFFVGENLFPVRVMAVTAVALCFVFLLCERILVRFIVRQMFRNEYGAKRAIIIGNHKNTEYLADYIAATPESGYRLAGVVANRRFIPRDLKTHQYSSLKDALRKARADVIFQTDEKSTKYVYRQAVSRHLLYYFVPSETALSSHFGDLELVGNTPAVLVKVTPLSGGYAVVKRAFDIVFSLVAIVLTIIPMMIIWIISKLSDIKHSPIYVDDRLTQYNRKFRCYKFRSMKSEYSGMTAEEAFIKMGKPELIKKYRRDGDYMKNDPRITRLGHFIRRASLDELPQLFNILKGDISLIGPRALLPGELRDYGDRSLLLTVKSGLTGFAQVSGRRNISFEERRALDIYYVKNWSLMLDLSIFFKTIAAVFRGEGAK
ncbi:MAG: exopolysaccharide biosynthesis polyprenyl glycosylphosphotransferase [Candidatus Saccharimonadaceae bacterium]|nr:exopolysaccharide biosynthesis polyprenyl glycosylphosphotransferase [Candidatus Saccharimonadaceae bacterium]